MVEFDNIAYSVSLHRDADQVLGHPLRGTRRKKLLAQASISRESPGLVHTKLDKAPADLIAALRQEGLPNIFVPAEDRFLEVDDIPSLGTGILDLKALKQMAVNLLQIG